ncbi:hypothetical protein F7U66_11040 [Vibrio parahaemolyticus]|nr:hypothetical protein [Vibrio parahaemolyticus]
MTTETKNNTKQAPFDIPGIYNQREALLGYLKIKEEDEDQLINISAVDNLHTFKHGNHLFEVFTMNPSNMAKFKRDDSYGSVGYSFNGSIYKIAGVPEHRDHVDIYGQYSVHMTNQTVVTMTGQCLLDCHLKDPRNRELISEYHRKPGVWWKVCYDGKFLWSCYAATKETAILLRHSDLQRLNKTDPKLLSAFKCSKNETYKPI